MVGAVRDYQESSVSMGFLPQASPGLPLPAEPDPPALLSSPQMRE